ncbi:glycoside hydrolase family 43 protein [Naasia lichenicola]|uniref:Glycoside hydrolase family 43 protein n=1 Tax=Naasia lichenicola TaxID=2565933 RepID=A0A4S4FGY2_9MICO|nr:glycoside hydrolase family 43 protein [Naasia lichenicola]THG29381.1 glycoside hydrolase family 43 protein [Naasia lichenicola]
MSTNPIVPGFHPDPSICRVGDEYFLVNSTFEYLPGVPIRRSSDLISWKLIGNVLDRPSQLPATTTGGGIFAPTIRHHGGRFWMITTDMDRVREGHLIVWSETADGPWSDPVFTAGAIGIDPDLAWDGDDCYLTWASFGAEFPISQARIDPETGRLLEQPRGLWTGTGLAATEGPHLYPRDGWWYLLVAEGGTERGHVVSIARSRSIEGPFEANPAGPILSHRSSTHPVQNTGHGDLVELTDGSWAMVHLGVRTRGVTPGFHVNGRETFVAGVDWIDGWPVVVEERFEVPSTAAGWDEAFESAEMAPDWIAAGRWPTEFAEVGGGLRLTASPADGPRMLGFRAMHETWRFEVELASGDAALIVRLDDDHAVRIRLVDDAFLAEATIGTMHPVLGERVPRGAGSALLRASALGGDRSMFSKQGPDLLRLSVVVDGTETELGMIDGRYVSTEVAGGFTGRILGVETGDSPSAIARIRYEGDASEAGSDTPAISES